VEAPALQPSEVVLGADQILTLQEEMEKASKMVLPEDAEEA
jgi:hypothetical protein